MGLLNLSLRVAVPERSATLFGVLQATVQNALMQLIKKNA
jgi:hypothetical protein